MKYISENKEVRESITSTYYKKELKLLFDKTAQWLSGDGRNSNIIISSRIRLARNLYGMRYTNRIRSNRGKSDELVEIMEKVYAALTKLSTWLDISFFEIEKLSELDKQFLLERRLISPFMIDVTGPAGLAVTKDQSSSIMINEEDHLRLQVIQSGFEITKAWKIVSNLDDELGKFLEYQFSEHFGYLTACPTNTGTGMRVSIFIHLPGLALNGEVENVMKDLAPSEVTIRGFYGEGTEVLGNIFQISNQLTLGRSEDAILKRMEFITNKLIEMESKAREALLKHNKILIEDKIYRAYGLLSQARIINSMEFIDLLSSLRLGFELGFIGSITRKVLNELMVLAQPAHLQKYYDEILPHDKRDILRAELIKKKLKL